MTRGLSGSDRRITSMTLITDKPRLYKGSTPKTWWLALTYEQSDDDSDQFIAREKIEITGEFKKAFAQELLNHERITMISEMIVGSQIFGMTELRDNLKAALGSPVLEAEMSSLSSAEKEAVDGILLVIDAIIEKTEEAREMIVLSVTAATQQKMAEIGEIK
jgi:hypothetical protein